MQITWLKSQSEVYTGNPPASGKAGTCTGLRKVGRLYEDSDACPKIELIWLCARAADEALGK